MTVGIIVGGGRARGRETLVASRFSWVGTGWLVPGEKYCLTHFPFRGENICRYAGDGEVTMGYDKQEH